MDAAPTSLREKLILAALGLLETTGEEPSLRAVARAAGVSAMTPYNHFADKAALLAAVSSHGFAALGRALAAADDKPDPLEALIAQGLALIAFARANPALFRLMYSHQYGSAETGAIRRTYSILADRAAELVPQHASAFTLACRSLVQGLATIILNDRLAPSTPTDIEDAVRLFAAGFGGRRS